MKKLKHALIQISIVEFFLKCILIKETAAGGEGSAVAAGDDMTAGKSKQSRGEKKARKIMSKLGLKQVGPLVNLTGR